MLEIIMSIVVSTIWKAKIPPIETNTINIGKKNVSKAEIIILCELLNIGKNELEYNLEV
jgi:hypothetical protein